jgi:hypothetical protein
MIATKLAVLMTAMMIVVGISVVPLLLVAEAAPINATRSNIKALVVQQEGEQACINQAEGHGDKAAVANSAQTAQTGEMRATQYLILM